MCVSHLESILFWVKNQKLENFVSLKNKFTRSKIDFIRHTFEPSITIGNQSWGSKYGQKPD